MIGASTVADHPTSTQRCQQMNAGLIMPTTEGEMASIRDTFTTYYSTPGYTRPTNVWNDVNPWYWIAMNTLNGQGSNVVSNWVWTRTRTTPATAYWSVGQPSGGDETCAHVAGPAGLQWNDISCAESSMVAQACELGE